MNCKNKSLRKFICLLFLFLFLLNGNLFTQKTEIIYGDEIKPGSQIYVITNRTVDSTKTGLTFTNDVMGKTSLMFLHVTYLNPDSLQVTELDSINFISDITKFNNDCLFFVHGDSKTFKQSVLRGLQIQYFHKVNVIVFSWPSKDPDINGAKNFKNSKQNVSKSLGHFTCALNVIEKFKHLNPVFLNDAKISMFIHSLGNYYLENLVKNNLSVNIQHGLFDNIIMNAAAVNQDFHNEWIEKLNFQKQIYVTSNKQDFNLKGVRIFTKDGKQLGEKIKHPLAGNAVYINFTKAVGFRFPTGTTHTYFIGEITDKSLNIREFYNTIMHGNSVDLNNTNQLEKRKDNLGYNIIFKNN